MNRNDGTTADLALRRLDGHNAQDGPDAVRRVRFSGSNDFQAALRRRVDEFLEHTDRRARDCPQMYVKTGVILLSFAVLYALLVFVASAWYTALPLAVILGLATAAIGLAGCSAAAAAATATAAARARRGRVTGVGSNTAWQVGQVIGSRFRS